MRQLRSITLSRSKSPFYPHGTYIYSFGLLATVDLRVYIFLFLWIVPFSLSDLHACGLLRISYYVVISSVTHRFVNFVLAIEQLLRFIACIYYLVYRELCNNLDLTFAVMNKVMR